MGKGPSKSLLTKLIREVYSQCSLSASPSLRMERTLIELACLGSLVENVGTDMPELSSLLRGELLPYFEKTRAIYCCSHDV